MSSQPATQSHAPAGRTPDKSALRSLVRAHYDWQHQRIAFGNRLAIHFRRGLGQEPGAPTDDLSKEAQQLIEDLKAEYGLLADAVAHSAPGRWNKLLVDHEGLIQSPYDLAMARHYRGIEEDEDDLRAAIATLVKDFPIWEWMESVRGVGPLMGAVIIAELDPYRAPHPSCFWSYCGLSVKRDGYGQSRRKEHLVVQTYTARDGTEQEKLGLGFSPFAKTKLIGVLGPSFLRTGGYYKGLYDDYKHRMESHPRYGLVAQECGEKEAHKKHRHDMAVRYMVKLFLRDLWREWRRLEGLPVGPDYAEAKLGLVHSYGAGAGWGQTPEPVQRADGRKTPVSTKRADGRKTPEYS